MTSAHTHRVITSCQPLFQTGSVFSLFSGAVSADHFKFFWHTRCDASVSLGAAEGAQPKREQGCRRQRAEDVRPTRWLRQDAGRKRNGGSYSSAGGCAARRAHGWRNPRRLAFGFGEGTLTLGGVCLHRPRPVSGGGSADEVLRYLQRPRDPFLRRQHGYSCRLSSCMQLHSLAGSFGLKCPPWPTR